MELMTEKPKKKDTGKALLEKGAKVAGETSSAAVGAVVGSIFGPFGVAIGAAAGSLVAMATKKVVHDITTRVISKREETKISLGAWYAASKIKEHLDSGHNPRDDDFFVEDNTGRSSAEEIFEGVLLKCKIEHEEKKARFIGNIFANMSFMDISTETANYILSLAEKMTYRQLCLISLIGRKQEFGYDGYFYADKVITHGGINTVSANSEENTSESFNFINQELCDLESAGVFGVKRVRNPYVAKGISKSKNNVMVKFYLRPVGQICFHIMSLGDVPREELNLLVDKLRNTLDTE